MGLTVFDNTYDRQAAEGSRIHLCPFQAWNPFQAFDFGL
jgi:hypothetical protein